MFSEEGDWWQMVKEASGKPSMQQEGNMTRKEEKKKSRQDQLGPFGCNQQKCTLTDLLEKGFITE